jgi:hypothetical protein
METEKKSKPETEESAETETSEANESQFQNVSKETENVSSKIETPKSKNKIEKTPEKISVPKVPTDPENIFVFEICKREGIWKKVKLFTF